MCTCCRADGNGNLPKKCTSLCSIMLSVELEGLLLVVCFIASNRSQKQVIREGVIISKDQGSCSCRTPFSVLRCLRKKMFFLCSAVQKPFEVWRDLNGKWFFMYFPFFHVLFSHKLLWAWEQKRM